MSQQRRALGKGIGALIPAAANRRGESPTSAMPGVAEGDRVERLGLDAIDLNPHQPRTHFDEALLAELTESVRERGVLQPILVRPKGPGRYELVAGERRFRASQRAGLSKIPALVKTMTDDESLLLAIVENVQRADLNALEEAQGYQVLLKDFGLTQEEVARRVGKSRPAIANALRLLQLPEATQNAVRSGTLSAGHARALLGLEDPASRSSLARQVTLQGLSVRETEKAVQRAKSQSAESKGKADPDLARMEADLSRALGTKVSISTSRSGDGHGQVQMSFYSDDDLARLIGILTSAAQATRSRSAGA